MKKKSVDEWLYMAGEKMEMENLKEPCEYHQFSDKFEKRMADLIAQVKKEETAIKENTLKKDVKRNDTASIKQKRRGRKRFSVKKWAAVAAAAVLICGLSISVYAYYRSLQMEVTQENNDVHVEIKEQVESILVDEIEDPTDKGKEINDGQVSLKELPKEGIEIPKVEITLGYIPEGYAQVEGMTHYYSEAGSYDSPTFWVEQNQKRDMADAVFVDSYEKKKLGAFDAVVVKAEEGDTWAVNRNMICLLNPEDMVSVAIYSDIPELSVEELEKLAENLTYEKTDEMILAYEEPQQAEMEGINEADLLVPKAQLVDEFDFKQPKDDTKAVGTMKVKNVVLADSIDGLDINKFYETDTLDSYLDDEGALIDERRYVARDNEGGSYRITEKADQKLMLITLEIQNTSDTDVEECLLTSYINIYEFDDAGENLKYMPCYLNESYYDLMRGGEWCYFDNPDNSWDAISAEERLHSFFSVDIPAGETRTVTIGRCIYTDQISQSYFVYSPLPVGFSAEFNSQRQLMQIEKFVE